MLSYFQTETVGFYSDGGFYCYDCGTDGDLQRMSDEPLQGVIRYELQEMCGGVYCDECHDEIEEPSDHSWLDMGEDCPDCGTWRRWECESCPATRDEILEGDSFWVYEVTPGKAFEVYCAECWTQVQKDAEGEPELQEELTQFEKREACYA